MTEPDRHYPATVAELHATIASFAEREPIDLSRLDAVEAALALPLADNPLLAVWHAVYGDDAAYVEQFRWVGPHRSAETPMEEDFAWDLVSMMLRRFTAPRYTYAIPGPEALDAIRAEADGRGVVEIGAGLGYWAALLQHHHVDVVATDADPGQNPWCHGHAPWTEVARLGAVTAARQAADAGRVLFVCWPSMDPWAGAAVAAYHEAGGRAVLYIGEAEGGCTGDDTLWGQLWDDDDEDDQGEGKRPPPLFPAAAEVAIPQWTGIHDRLVIGRRG